LRKQYNILTFHEQRETLLNFIPTQCYTCAYNQKEKREKERLKHILHSNNHKENKDQ